MFSYLHQPKGFYKHLFLLALPVIVQNLITTSLGFLDTFMVGLLGSDQMSAVTVANVPVFIIQLVVFGLQSGSSVLISQYWGRGDRESINRVMGIGFMIAGGVSVLFAAILCAFPAQVLYLITDNLTLVELAEPYLRIVGFSYIFNSLSSIYIGMQRSIENPRFGMIVFAISMLCNTLGNYVLIFGKLGLPALGITGAAVATLLSRVVEFVVAFSYAFRCRTMPLMKHAILRPGMDMLRKFLRYSAPVLINETLWGTGFSMITVIMGHMANSSDLIAAYTLAGNIDKLMTSGVFGIAAAVSVIVGKEIGTGNLKGVYNIGRALCFTAFAFGIVLGLAEYTMFVTLMRPFVMPLFSLSAVAERLCSVMLMCYACAIPLHSFSTTMVVGVLRGGGDVNASLVIDNFPLWCGTLPMMCLLGLVLKVPNEVFCLCLMIEYIIKKKAEGRCPSAFPFSLSSFYRALPPHFSQHRHADTQRRRHKERDADHAVHADMLVVHDDRQRRCQNGLDEINERRLRRRGVLRDLRREQKADGRAADADMAQKQRRFERKAREKRNAREYLQPQAAVKRTDRRNLTEHQQEKELQTADEHVERRDHERAEPRQTQFAERAVSGKQQRGGDDLQKAAQADLKVRGIEDEENADKFHADGQQMVLFQRLMQDEVRQRHREHRIARVDNRCS